jgi:hypothetical protein
VAHVDTLQIYERLRKASLPDDAAREIAEVINEITEGPLVTKQYLDIKLKELEASLIKWVIGVVLVVATVQAAIIVTLIKVL